MVGSFCVCLFGRRVRARDYIEIPDNLATRIALTIATFTHPRTET